MPCCGTNKFVSTKRKLPRDLVISSEAQTSAEVAMAKRIRFDCSFPAILFAIMFAALGLGGCTSGTKSRTLSSQQVTPANPSVAEGSQQQLTATGTFTDGSTQDLTKLVAWSSSDNSSVTIDSAGLATTHSLGRPKITAATGSGAGLSPLVMGSTHLIIVAGPGTSTPRFAYVTNLSDDTLSIYSVNPSSGQLRPHGYVLTDRHPEALCLDPSGKFAYTANNQANDVSAFTVDSATGSLTPVPGSPFAAGGGPNSVAIDPTGRFAFVANSTVNIPVFSIDVSTGALQPIPGSPFPAGTVGGIATLHPTGRFLYTINQNTNSVNGLTVDPATGTLGPMP